MDVVFFNYIKVEVYASSQNRASNVILFFFRHILRKYFVQISDVVRAYCPDKRLPQSFLIAMVFTFQSVFEIQ